MLCNAFHRAQWYPSTPLFLGHSRYSACKRFLLGVEAREQRRMKRKAGAGEGWIPWLSHRSDKDTLSTTCLPVIRTSYSALISRCPPLMKFLLCILPPSKTPKVPSALQMPRAFFQFRQHDLCSYQGLPFAHDLSVPPKGGFFVATQGANMSMLHLGALTIGLQNPHIPIPIAR